MRKDVEQSARIADNIAKAMDARGMTPQDLAEKMGVNTMAVALWLSGLHNFDLRELCALSDALNVELIKIAYND